LPRPGSAESAIQTLQRNSQVIRAFSAEASKFHDPGAVPQASDDLPRRWRYAPIETKCSDEIVFLR